jgi:hypothetical protein
MAIVVVYRHASLDILSPQVKSAPPQGSCLWLRPQAALCTDAIAGLNRKMAFKPITEEQYVAGTDIGRHRLETATIAQSVSYGAIGDRIVLEIRDCSLGIPRWNIGELAGLSPEDLSGIRLSAIGDAITVGSCDVQIDLAGLIADIMPQTVVKRTFAKRGGRATSPTKANASRAI